MISNESTPILCVPLKAPGTMYGVIYLEGADPRRGFEPEHMMYAKGLAKFTRMAIRLAGQGLSPGKRRLRSNSEPSPGASSSLILIGPALA